MAKKNDLELITENLAALTAAVQTLNDVQLVLLHNVKNLELPEWEKLEDIEKDVGEKVTNCIKSVRKVYGQRQADKS